MNVRFEKKLWCLKMKPWLFKRLQKEQPDLNVNIEEVSLSSNSEKRRLKIKELQVQ
jgi:hypothetical protein